MESIFLILSGAVLAAGILYWFWSHIQLTQKKVQLLENAVFELRGLQGLGSLGSGSSGSSGSGSSDPVPEYKDEEDDWANQSQEENQSQENQENQNQERQSQNGGSTPLSALDATPIDLQPGGRAVTQVVSEVKPEDKDAQFRELFIQHESRVPTPSVQSQSQSQGPVTSESLESMPVKELRRLAEQRGLTGVSELRKKELLAALRNQITPAPASVAQTEEVVVERTIDLTEETVVLE